MLRIYTRHAELFPLLCIASLCFTLACHQLICLTSPPALIYSNVKHDSPPCSLLCLSTHLCASDFLFNTSYSYMVTRNQMPKHVCASNFFLTRNHMAMEEAVLLLFLYSISPPWMLQNVHFLESILNIYVCIYTYVA